MPAPSTVHTPTKATQQPSLSRRRSARVLEQNPIVAPGYGTRKDLIRLANELSEGSGTVLPVEAVEAMMKSRGRGVRKRGEEEKEEAATAAPVSNAWADFMAEEGVSAPAAEEAAEPSSTAAASKKRHYELPLGLEPAKKKAKTAKIKGGILLQTGTLDSSVVGRTKVKDAAPFHLTVPTNIMPKTRITKVFTSCNAVHSVAVDESGTAYGWGRNEASQLGSHLPDEVVMPTQLDLPDKLSAAALGKSHTIFLLRDASLFAVGANKAGQCGVRNATEIVPNYRKCVLENVTIIKISCGEDFSVALSSEGHVYTTGSSEYGQLGNGETGEYFITANKLGFANCNVFTRRTTFYHAPKEKLWANNEESKVVPIDEDIRIQDIACGKHHSLAIEAASDQTPRVFSWGCGNYGCLGHGAQKDEYFPRLIGTLKNAHLGQGKLSVSAGAHCSLMQTSNGHVYYWGKHRSVGEATMRPQLVDALANNQHVVAHCAAGGQTVVCCTTTAQTIAWGQGPHGELGLGTPKSSAKPTFVTALDGCQVADLACGYGHTLFVVRSDDKADAEARKKLAKLDDQSVKGLIRAAEAKGNRKRP